MLPNSYRQTPEEQEVTKKYFKEKELAKQAALELKKTEIQAKKESMMSKQ